VAGRRALLTAAGVAALQAAALTVFAVVVVAQALRGDESSAANVVLLVLLVLAWAVGLGVVARGLRDRHRWARAPMLLSELLLLAVGIPLLQGDAARWVGVVVIASAAVGTVAVLSPSVTSALGGDS
jgi:hypothetical protein